MAGGAGFSGFNPALVMINKGKESIKANPPQMVTPPGRYSPNVDFFAVRNFETAVNLTQQELVRRSGGYGKGAYGKLVARELVTSLYTSPDYFAQQIRQRLTPGQRTFAGEGSSLLTAPVERSILSGAKRKAGQ